MATIKGPIRFSASDRSINEQLTERLWQAVLQGEAKVNLPFEAKGWKSKFNADIVERAAEVPKEEVVEKTTPEIEIDDLIYIKGIGKGTIAKLKRRFKNIAELKEALIADKINFLTRRRIVKLKKFLLE